MGLRTEYEIDPEGTTVPYAPLFDSVRQNHGFKDIRGDVSAAENIPEAKVSRALRRLLVTLAQPCSSVVSLGCDLGEHEDTNASPDRRRVAGGYVQVVAADYEKTPPDSYDSFAAAVERVVKRLARNHHWTIQFVLKGVVFKFEGASDTARPSLWIWFFASASNKGRAADSRERLIDSIAGAFSRREVLANLAASQLSTEDE